MRLEWLEDILAVAQTGSFSEAAEQRHLTQSAFSRRVQMIENQIGVELFDRSHKPVQLRPTTEAQRERMHQLAHQLRTLVEELRRGERLAQNRIVIASQHALTAAFAPKLVRRMHDHRAEVYTKLRSANLDECIRLLLSRQADIALLFRLPDEVGELAADFIETQVVDQDRLIPCASPDVAKSAHGTGLVSLPLIAYPADVQFGRIFVGQIAPQIEPRFLFAPTVETALSLAVVELAAAGAGVAWLPRTLAERCIGDGRLVDLGDILPGADVAIVAARLTGRSSPAEHLVWSFLKQWE